MFIQRKYIKNFSLNSIGISTIKCAALLKMAHLTEDHGLAYRDGTVDVRQRLILLLQALTLDVVLCDVV